MDQYNEHQFFGVKDVFFYVETSTHDTSSYDKFWVVATQICFIFTPKIGEDEPILTSIFFKRVETTKWRDLKI